MTLAKTSAIKCCIHGELTYPTWATWSSLTIPAISLTSRFLATTSFCCICSLVLSLSNPFCSRNGNCGHSIFDESQWLTSRFAVKSDSSGDQVSGLVCLTQSAVWTPQLRINTPEGHFTPSATIALDVNIKWITP